MAPCYPRPDPAPPDVMPQAVKRRRFTLEEYHRMGEAGILADDPRIELLAGAVVVREPTGSRGHRGSYRPPLLLSTGRPGHRPRTEPRRLSGRDVGAPAGRHAAAATDRFLFERSAGRGRRAAPHRGGGRNPAARPAREDSALCAGRYRRGLA